ncbi:PAS domain-containing serine/threonine-protein kinase-like isoform X1 [Centruroides vittatus]|uniref:PAS domain-containing serine/threonine-protein kinase-like isoform X1 n=3 Tax=Centruroides vittatus TaxID=120091 RepID=UPI00350FB8AF
MGDLRKCTLDKFRERYYSMLTGDALNSFSFSPGCAKRCFALTSDSFHHSRSLSSSWSLFNFLGEGQQTSFYIQNLNKAIVTINAKTTEILVVNKMACRLLGLNNEQLNGKHLCDFFVSKSGEYILTETELESSGELIVMSGKVMDLKDGHNQVIPVSVWMRRLPVDIEPRCLVVMEPVERTTSRVTFNGKGIIADCDKNLAILHGYSSPNDLIGLNITELIPSLLLPLGVVAGRKLPKEVKKQSATGRTRDGSTFPLTIFIEPIDFNGITDIKDSNNDKINEHCVYCGIIWVFANISGMITIFPDGNIHSCNTNFSLMLFGYTSSQLVGKSITTLIPSFYDDLEFLECSMQLPSFDDDDDDSCAHCTSDGRTTADSFVTYPPRPVNPLGKQIEFMIDNSIENLQTLSLTSPVITSPTSSEFQEQEIHFSHKNVPDSHLLSVSSKVNYQPHRSCSPLPLYPEGTLTKISPVSASGKISLPDHNDNIVKKNSDYESEEVDDVEYYDAEEDLDQDDEQFLECERSKSPHSLKNNFIKRNIHDCSSLTLHLSSQIKEDTLLTPVIDQPKEQYGNSPLTPIVSLLREGDDQPSEGSSLTPVMDDNLTSDILTDHRSREKTDISKDRDQKMQTRRAGNKCPLLYISKDDSHLNVNPELKSPPSISEISLPERVSSSCSNALPDSCAAVTSPQDGSLSMRLREILMTRSSQESLHSIPEGSYFGLGRHRDGSDLGINYQIRRIELDDGQILYCLWVARDMEESYDGHPYNTTWTSNSLNSASTISVDTPTAFVGQSPREWVESQNFSQPQSVTEPLDTEYVSGEYVEKYVTLQQIGKGAFGCVKMAYRNSDHLLVITKFICKAKVYEDCWVFDSVLMKRVPLEVSLLTTLKHPNIIEVLDVFENEKYFQMVMEKHGSGMDLFEFIDRNPNLDEPLASYIFRQVVSALTYLHSLNILHRDIKDENIILNEHFHVKLIDFGSATFLAPNHSFSTFCGTMEYCSPEVLQGNRYKGPELEMWALGVTLYTLIFGENPFFDIEETIAAVLNPPAELAKKTSPELLDLISMLLHPDPKLRCTLEEVEKHPWTRLQVSPENYKFEEVVCASAAENNPPKYYNPDNFALLDIAPSENAFSSSIDLSETEVRSCKEELEFCN